MNATNIPGFTAENALYRSSDQYRSHSLRGELAGGVTAQFCCQDFRDCEECLSDCLADGDYPEECRQQCHCECFGRDCP
jgi:hypothetical protein